MKFTDSHSECQFNTKGSTIRINPCYSTNVDRDATSMSHVASTRGPRAEILVECGIGKIHLIRGLLCKCLVY